MDVTVVGTMPEIEIHPGEERLEIIQNVRMILATVKGTVPLDREFGLRTRLVDMPIDRARTLLVREVHEQLRRYEPRAKVVRVICDGDQATAADGRLLPRVVLRIEEGL